MKINTKGMSGHHSANSKTNSWLTPPEILHSLGEFDLDPCACINQPWPTAKAHYTEVENGLLQNWFGRVWLNPPYSSKLIIQFMKRMAEHNNGIALTFARTETKFFQQYVFPIASSLLFLSGRIRFCTTAGNKAKGTGGAPSVLIAYNTCNSDVLAASGLKGKHVSLAETMIVVGISPSWYSIVSIAVKHYGDEELKPVYDMVERMAADKIVYNQHWKAKVRQQLQVIRRKQKTNIQNLEQCSISQK